MTRLKIVILAAVYVAFGSLANPSFAGAPNVDTLNELRDGSMKKLTFHAEPKPVSDTTFLTESEDDVSLEEYRGKYVVLNFWATWCAPCRKEMPALNALQTQFGGEGFAVVTVATGRNPIAAIDTFFDDAGIDALPKHRDPSQSFARDMGVLGLPITVIISPEGQEIARLRGDAEWHSASAQAIVSALLQHDD
jgi:thiol-disulfide isomerase/thioredoxin